MPVQSGGVSSLIFLVVIGVWAAYFIQYWVRRRDHLATARSVDQFSESMRVLERRSPLPATDLSEPQRQSYAVGPARPSRPQVLVKRAAASPIVAAAPDARDTGAGPAAEDRSGTGGRRPLSRPDATARATARRNRTLVMGGALSTWLVAIPLVALGLLGWAYLAVPAASVAVAVAWARRSTRTSGATQAHHSRTHSRGHDVPTAATGPGHVATPRRNQPLAAPRARGELYDLQEVEARTSRGSGQEAAAPAAAQPSPAPQPARPLVDEDDIPLTWDPVPVPRPTYTLKARATRPAPTAADLVGDADTEYADPEYTADEEAEPARRVAGA